MLAVRLGVAPSVLWDEDPRDLATIIAVLAEQAEGEGGD